MMRRLRTRKSLVLFGLAVVVFAAFVPALASSLPSAILTPLWLVVPAVSHRGRSSHGRSLRRSAGRASFARPLPRASRHPRCRVGHCRICGSVEAGPCGPGVEKRSRRESCRYPTAGITVQNTIGWRQRLAQSSGLAGRVRPARLRPAARRDQLASALDVEQLSDGETRGASARRFVDAGRRATRWNRSAPRSLRSRARPSRRALGLRPFDVQVARRARARSRRTSSKCRPARARRSPPSCRRRCTRSTGRGVHVLTFNDYLARRDAEWMGPVYRDARALGRLRAAGHDARGAPSRLPRRRHLRHRQRGRIRSPARSAGDRSPAISCTGRSTSRSWTKPTRS